MDIIKIGRFIAALRQEKGWTQQQLGEKLGVTNKTISRWETGSYLPPVEMLQLLSGEFGVTINELLTGERLNAEGYRANSEENLKTILRESGFSVQERYAYWKGKWKQDHRMLRILFPAAVIVLLGVGIWLHHTLLLGATSLLGLFGRLVINNQMMAYIEKHTFEDQI